jgi:SNF2 family DNA or RNA helicase
MKVEYESRTNLLIITCKIFENDFPRNLPNRKFNNKLKGWTAPCVRFNAMVIKEKWYPISTIHISDEAKQAIEDVIQGLGIKKNPFPEKFPFKMEPRDYQKRGLDYTYSLNVCAYHMAMGSGKSKMAIDKLSCHFIEGQIKAILMVCPCSVRHVWITQFLEHCPLDYELKIIPSSKELTKGVLKELNEYVNIKSDKLKVLVVGTESLQQVGGKALKIATEFMGLNSAAVVVDEAHDIKNAEASRSKNLFNITRKSPYRIVMTGTPVSQGILDLYGLFQFLEPNIIGIGDYWSFKRRYAITQDIQVDGRRFKKIVGYQNIDELMDLIRPFTYQVTKEEAAKELPEKIRLKRYVTMNKEQVQVYNDIRKKRVADVMNDKGQPVGVVINHVLAAFTALQQIAGGFVSRGTGQYNNSGKEIRETLPVTKTNPKITELKKVIDELDDTEQVIIWCRYRAEVALIQKELSGYKTNKFKHDSVVYLDKTAAERSEIEKAMDRKEIRYFISTPNSGGTGLTMNTVAYVVYFSNSQRLLYREQSEDRNHRIGQQRNVTYIDIIAEKTVDERILTSLKDKKDLSEYVKSCLENNRLPF